MRAFLFDRWPLFRNSGYTEHRLAFAANCKKLCSTRRFVDGFPFDLSDCLRLLMGCIRVDVDHGGHSTAIGGVLPQMVAEEGDPASDTFASL
ncbi:MAG: hypothetical protein ABGX10_16895 [Paracoccus sp. (in: a-proteobacteria)]